MSDARPTPDDSADLTVVIPVWDGYVRYLAAAVRSVAAQSTTCRIVVVDNASAVPMPAMAPRCQVLRLPQRVSLAQAKNTALAQVRTPYVSFLDADDVLLPGAVDFLLREIRSHRSLAVVAGRLMYAYPTGEHVLAGWPRRAAYLLAGFPRLFGLYLLVENGLLVNSGSVLRTALVRDLGGFGRTPLHEDWVLSALVGWRHRARICRTPTSLYVRHADSRTGHLTPAQRRANIAMVRRHLGAHPLVPWYGRAVARLLAGRTPVADGAAVALHAHADTASRERAA